MNRKQALQKIRFCGFHGNYVGAIAVWMSTDVSRKERDDEYQVGVGMKKAGVKCNCPECKKQEGSKSQ